MKKNKEACRVAISEAIGVDDWEKVDFSKNPVANVRFEALSTRCLSDGKADKTRKEEKPAAENMNLPVVKARGGAGRSVDFSRFDPEDESTYPENEAASYFINGCDGGSIAPKARQASSVLPNWKDKTYTPSKMLDHDPLSAWVEGKQDYGVGEWFEIYCNNLNTVFNGYQSSPEHWLNNSRVKRFKVYIDGTPVCYLDLTDEMGEQRFELPFKSTWDKGHLFRFEIADVYKGNKWPDVCISEIGVQGCCVLWEDLGVADIASSALTVQRLDMKSLRTSPVSVSASTERIHFTLWEISVGDKSIKVSPEHKMYVKDRGFVPMVQLCDLLDCTPERLPQHGVELLMYDGKTTRFERLDRLVIHKGEFRTVAIRSIESGDHFLINGFVQKTY